jgi:hypothetical protein
MVSPNMSFVWVLARERQIDLGDQFVHDEVSCRLGVGFGLRTPESCRHLESPRVSKAKAIVSPFVLGFEQLKRGGSDGSRTVRPSGAGGDSEAGALRRPKSPPRRLVGPEGGARLRLALQAVVYRRDLGDRLTERQALARTIKPRATFAEALAHSC